MISHRVVLLISGLGIVLLLGLAVIAYGGQPRQDAQSSVSLNTQKMEKANPVVLKIATPYKKGSFQSQVLHQFCYNANQQFGGQIYIQIYEDGALGDELEILDALSNKRLEMAAVSSESLPYLVKGAAVPLTIPFSAASSEEAQDLLDSEKIQALYQQLEEQGIFALDSFYNGHRYIWSVGPVYDPEDLSEISLGLPPQAFGVEEVFGDVVAAAEIVPVSSIPVKLETGEIDAYELSLSEAAADGCYQYTPYCLKLGTSYSSTTLLISDEALDLLGPDEREILYSCAAKAVKFSETLYKSKSVRWVLDMETAGITFSELSADAYQDIKSRMQEQFLETGD